MKKDEFKRLLLEPEKKPTVDWNSQRDNWKSHVESLYSDIAKWTTDFTTAELLRIEREPISITEEEIGTYSIDKLIVMVAGRTVVFEPVGTLLIGAWGRINVHCAGKKESLLLLPPSTMGVSEMINVQISLPDETGSVKGSIFTGSATTQADGYPALCWKILQEASMSFIDLTEEAFFDLLASLLK